MPRRRREDDEEDSGVQDLCSLFSQQQRSGPGYDAESPDCGGDDPRDAIRSADLRRSIDMSARENRAIDNDAPRGRGRREKF